MQHAQSPSSTPASYELTRIANTGPEVDRMKFEGHSWLHSEFDSSLGSMTPCLIETELGDGVGLGGHRQRDRDRD